ncbi:cell division protein FtsA C-terminal domain-containing protein, partial [Enterococcus faecalis]|nr:cell division protein FtsA C-terminal domain-containing protein [Enterococcus faecalis]
AQAAVNGEEYLRSKPIDIPNYRPSVQPSNQQVDEHAYGAVDEIPAYSATEEEPNNRQKLGDKVRGIFGSMFE